MYDSRNKEFLSLETLFTAVEVPVRHRVCRDRSVFIEACPDSEVSGSVSVNYAA